MKKYSDLTHLEKFIMHSIWNGWVSSGTYLAISDGKQQEFTADTQQQLASDIAMWYSENISVVPDKPVVVKQVKMS